MVMRLMPSRQGRAEWPRSRPSWWRCQPRHCRWVIPSPTNFARSAPRFASPVRCWIRIDSCYWTIVPWAAICIRRLVCNLIGPRPAMRNHVRSVEPATRHRRNSIDVATNKAYPLSTHYPLFEYVLQRHPPPCRFFLWCRSTTLDRTLIVVEPVIKRLQAHAQRFGSGALIDVEVFQRRENETLFELLQRCAEGKPQRLQILFGL